MSQGFVGEQVIWRNCAVAIVALGFCLLVPYLVGQREEVAAGRGRLRALQQLKRIAAAQELFASQDADLDRRLNYGELSQLGRVMSELEREGGQLPGSGYVFWAGPGADPLATHYAIANPSSASGGGPAFFLNQEGQIYRRELPYQIAEVSSGCPPPLGSELLGGE